MAEIKRTRTKLSRENAIKATIVLNENKNEWGNGSKTTDQVQKLLKESCGITMAESSFLEMSKTIGYMFKRVVKVTPNAHGNRITTMATILEMMFVSLEEEIGMEPGTIGAKNGARRALKYASTNIASQKLLDMLDVSNTLRVVSSDDAKDVG